MCLKPMFLIAKKTDGTIRVQTMRTHLGKKSLKKGMESIRKKDPNAFTGRWSSSTYHVYRTSPYGKPKLDKQIAKELGFV